jgi:dolichol-phosphate mannosyltransferase
MQMAQVLRQENLPAFIQFEIIEDTPNVSFVIPVFNEENNVEEAVEKLSRVASKLGRPYEIVVVNDGSYDNTLLRIRDCAESDCNVRVISYRKNMGKGYAVKTGFLHARGVNVVFIDGDLDIDPNQIEKYLNALKSADMVIASKWHPQSKIKIRSLRRFLSQSFNILVRLLTGVRMMDTQTGLKAVKNSALKRTFSKLTVKRYAYDVELLTIASRDGIKTVELPVNLRLPALFNLKDAWRMFLDLFGIAYRLKISRCY